MLREKSPIKTTLLWKIVLLLGKQMKLTMESATNYTKKTSFGCCVIVREVASWALHMHE